jgi:hypothetical protein
MNSERLKKRRNFNFTATALLVYGWRPTTTFSWMPCNRTKSLLFENVHNCVGVTSLHSMPQCYLSLTRGPCTQLCWINFATLHATVLFVTYQRPKEFEIQTAVTLKSSVLQDLMPWGLVNEYQHLEECAASVFRVETWRCRNPTLPKCLYIPRYSKVLGALRMQ